MANKKFYNDSSFWAGVGSYYLFSYIFLFYPAFVLSLSITQNLQYHCGWEADNSLLLCVGLFFFFSLILGFLQGLAKIENNNRGLILIYLITLIPFLSIIKHYWDNIDAGDAYGAIFPFPSINWIPFI